MPIPYMVEVSLKVKTLFIIAVLMFSCAQPKGDDEGEPVIKDPTKRDSSVTMLDVDIPDGKGGYAPIKAVDFVNGSYSLDITAAPLREGFNPVSDELTAVTNGIFLGAPGLLFSIDPPVSVDVTLSTKGRSQTVQKNPNDKNFRLGISLASFDQLFPPAYRERYELTIKSPDGSIFPFSYTYTFTVKREGVESVYAEVRPGDAKTAIRLGRDTPNFILSKIVTSEKCDACTIEVSSQRVSAVIKKVTELPTFPIASSLRVAPPKRYSGLIVSTATVAIPSSVLGNGTDQARIATSIPASATLVAPWCGVSTCVRRIKGQDIQTYFGFLNAIPSASNEGAFGGVSGVASVLIYGEASIVVKRDGVEIDRRDVTFDSGVISPLESPLLPVWAVDEIKNALLSGAPEFSP